MFSRSPKSFIDDKALAFYNPDLHLIFLLACGGPAADQNSGGESGKKQTADTLVYSVPVNYIKSLDTLNEENISPMDDYRDMMDLFDQRNHTPESRQGRDPGNYGIAAFESPQESVSAYMLNYNTHRAYAGLRERRAELRKSRKKVTGPVLAEQLTSYSERGQEYVDGLKSLINFNRLAPEDDAYLSDMGPIYMLPAEE